MLNESVINVLKNGMWDLATCANGEQNVVPVAFKDVTQDISYGYKPDHWNVYYSKFSHRYLLSHKKLSAQYRRGKINNGKAFFIFSSLCFLIKFIDL